MQKSRKEWIGFRLAILSVCSLFPSSSGIYIQTPSAKCNRCFYLDYLPDTDNEADQIQKNIIPVISKLPEYLPECRTLKPGGAVSNQTSPIAKCYSLFVPLILESRHNATAILMSVRGAYLNEKEIKDDEVFIADRIQPYLNRLHYVIDTLGQKLKVMDEKMRLVSCTGDFCNNNYRKRKNDNI